MFKKLIFPFVVLVALSGCAAAPASKQGMIVQPTMSVKAAQKGQFAVAKVSGGKTTNPF